MDEDKNAKTAVPDIQVTETNIYTTGARFYTVSDKIFLFIMNAMLLIFSLIVLYPLIYVVSMSFSSITAVLEGRVWLWPVDITLLSYQAVFSNRFIVSGYTNSLVYMVFSASLSMFMTMLCAYPLTRDFKGKNVVMFLITFTMFFGGGLIPYYLLISRLKLINTAYVMIIPGALSAWNVIVTRTFIKTTISEELRDAAELDGCDDFQYLFRIVFPLSQAIIAVVLLWTAVGSWNSYFNAMIFLQDKTKWPLQMVLREVLIINEMRDMTSVAVDVRQMANQVALREMLKYSLIVVASVPLLIIYPFVQKYFVKGVMIGSLKG